MAYYNRLLPNPMEKPDGTIVSSAEEWEQQKIYLKELAQEHMYGIWPGKADSVEAAEYKKETVLDRKAVREQILLHVNYQGCVFPMDIVIFRPDDTLQHPVAVANAYTHQIDIESGYVPLLIDHGYALASFLMADIVPDPTVAEYFHLPPIDKDRVFPKLPCATIMAWGWGHSVVADYLMTRDFTGPLIATGASRGGKAALCGAIFDERFRIAAPVVAGCGGTGSARFCGTADGSRQDPVRCETIGRITHVFPDWFNEKYRTYGSQEEPYAIGDEVNSFPLDANVLRAMMAPRAVFNSEATEDPWSNPYGTQLAWMAAQPVFDFLGVPENNGFHIRPGEHGFDIHDWEGLIAFCDRVLKRENPMPCSALNQPYFKDIDLSLYA